MKQSCKYDISGLYEAQFEAGSQNKVLKNLLGVTDESEMDILEARSLIETERDIISKFSANHRFKSKDICFIHKMWLGSIYPWAGKYRKVNLSKGDFQFATAELIPSLMNNFEKNQLKRLTPCNFPEQDKVISAISEVHVELILIHPFREGNGRLARLFSSIMALQAGYSFLDYSDIKDGLREEYFKAVQAGLDRNYKPMENIFRIVFKKASFLRG